MFETGSDENDRHGSTGGDGSGGPGGPGGGRAGDGAGDDAVDRVKAHDLLDRVLDADAADAGAVLGGVIEAHAGLGRVLDGRLVAVLAGWEASGDWAQDGSPTAVSWLVTHTGMARKAAGGLRRTGRLVASMPAVAAAAAAGVLPLSHVQL